MGKWFLIITVCRLPLLCIYSAEKNDIIGLDSVKPYLYS